MSEITEEKINKRIAEFMGSDRCLCPIPSPSSHHENCLNDECRKYIDTYTRRYTKSLDSLVPVIEKLQESLFVYMDSFWESGYFQVKIISAEDIVLVMKSDKSPSLALSTAIYNILERKD